MSEAKPVNPKGLTLPAIGIGSLLITLAIAFGWAIYSLQSHQDLAAQIVDPSRRQAALDGAQTEFLVWAVIIAVQVVVLLLFAGQLWSRSKLEADAVRLFSEISRVIPGFMFQHDFGPSGSLAVRRVVGQTESFLGVTPEELQADPMLLSAFVHPEDAPKFIDTVRNAQSSENLIAWQGRIVSRAGKVKWARLLMSPVRLRDDLKAWVGVVLDITEAKQHEREAIESRQLMKTIMDALPMMVNAKDLNGRYLFYNKAGLEPLNLREEDVIGLTVGELAEIANRDQIEKSRKLASGLAGRDQLILETGKPQFNFEVFHKGADRTIVEQMSKIPIRDSEGHISGIVTIALDITERRRAELEARRTRDLLRRIIDSVPAYISVKDSNHKYRFINRLEAERLGLANIGDAIGRRDMDLINADSSVGLTKVDVEEREQREREVIEKGQASALQELTRVNAEGQHLYCLGTLVPAFDSAGRVDGVISVEFDVTDMRRAQNELMRTTQLMRSVFDAAPSQIFVMDRNRRVQMTNKVMFPGKYDEDFVRNPDRLIGEKASAWPKPNGVSQEEWDAVIDHSRRCVYAALYEGKQVRRSSMSYVIDGNRRIYYDFSAFPIFGPDGSVDGVLAISTDTTEQKVAELERQRTSDLLRTVIDSVPVAISLKDRDRRYIMVNKEFEVFWQVSEEGIRGKRFEDVVQLDVTDRDATEILKITEERDQKVINERAAMAVKETVYRRLDSREVQIMGSKIPLFAEDGEVSGVLTVGIDVTELKRAEAHARSQEAMLRTIIDSVPVLISVKDRELKYTMVNRAFEDFWLVTGDTVKGKTFEDAIVPMFSANNQPEILFKTKERDREVLEERKTLNYQDFGYRPWDRVMRNALVSKVPFIDESGNATGVLTVATDVTELKQAEAYARSQEAMLRAIIDQLPARVFAIDLEGAYLLTNRRHAEYMGQPAEKLLGRTLRDFIGSFDGHSEKLVTEQCDRIELLEREIMQTGSARLGYEEELVYPGGRRQTEVVNRIPLRDQQGRVGGLLILAYDITAQKLLENELREASAMAEAGSRAKSEFLAHMSHELRTPLNAIIGFSEMLLGEYFGPLGAPRNKEYVADIHRSGKHLLELISDVLDLSKIEAGKYNVENEDIVIGAWFDEMRSLLGRQFELGEVMFSVHASPDLPVLRGDRLRLDQVLVNLLTNARKFTPKGGEVELRAIVNPAGELVVSVVDNGIGIDAKDLPGLFQPFKQAGAYVARNNEGTGLGLAICKGIVEAHSGQISIASEKGKGSTVTVTFPASRLDSRDQKKTPALPSAGV